jgi:hypothetical protein
MEPINVPRIRSGAVDDVTESEPIERSPISLFYGVLSPLFSYTASPQWSLVALSLYRD